MFVSRKAIGAAVLALLAGGCAPLGVSTQESASPVPQLPPLTVEQLAADSLSAVPAPVAPADPLARFPAGETITLSAVDVDVRALLPALAEAADLSLVMGPEVTGRVSVNLIDVPALEALAVVLEEAGLMIAPEPLVAPWGPVVFYVLPVNILEADLELIRARYRVSHEMARWIVETRLP